MFSNDVVVNIQTTLLISGVDCFEAIRRHRIRAQIKIYEKLDNLNAPSAVS
ncbi:MAG: hypothetical protein ABF333_04335 [Akkermansiaceae bacterium]